MLEAGYSPTKIIYNTMIKAECRGGNLDAAIALIDQMAAEDTKQAAESACKGLLRENILQSRPEIAAAVNLPSFYTFFCAQYALT